LIDRSLAWHPLGHVLASGSNDNATKFWSRSKPGDTLDDFYHQTVASAQLNVLPASQVGILIDFWIIID